jgi:plastocyanin
VKRRVCGIALVAFGAFASPALATDTEIKGTDALVWDQPEVSIAPGDTVTWSFDGTTQFHHVKANGSTPADDAWASFESPLLIAGPPKSYTFTTEGVYNFFCSVHKDTMIGKVTVSVAPVPTPVPTPVPLSAQPFVNDAPPVVAPETSVALDKAKPGLTALSAKRRAKGVARVKFKVSEESVTGIVFARGKKIVKSYAVAGHGGLYFDAKGLRAGRYTVTVVAVDLAGNQSKARRLRLTVR